MNLISILGILLAFGLAVWVVYRVGYKRGYEKGTKVMSVEWVKWNNWVLSEFKEIKNLLKEKTQ